MIILAIETSCDETSVAIVEDGYKIHSLVTNSQIDLHRAFGGVVPEVAARSHIEVMLPVIDQALNEAFPSSSRHPERSEEVTSPKNKTLHYIQNDIRKWQWSKIDAIAVTQGPGLSGALLIGVLTARTLAWSMNKPLIPVHHILGHVYANWLTEQANPAELSSRNQELRETSPNSHSSEGRKLVQQSEQSEIASIPASNVQLPTSKPEFPILALIVSGGHSQLMYATDHASWQVIGRTQDDAVGEAFDKAAKVLGLPYPGGPSVAKMAEKGNANKYGLPTPKVGDKYGFSFSGLKTALLRAVQKEAGVTHDFPSFELAARLNNAQKADFAASFQRTAINYLVSKTKLAFEDYSPTTVIIGGGVAASLPLRKALSEAIPLEIQYAPQVLCTDNAAMIGTRAFYQLKSEDPVNPRHLEIKPSWPL